MGSLLKNFAPEDCARLCRVIAEVPTNAPPNIAAG